MLNFCGDLALWYTGEKILDPTDEMEPAATAEQIRNREEVLEFMLSVQVR